VKRTASGTEWVTAPRPATDDFLRAVAVHTAFDGRPVLRGVDLAIRRGEVFVIMGPSGCGKTTMLRHLCGLQPPDAGTVFVNGHDVFHLSAEDLRALRMRTGMSFQGGALLGSLTVEENVALPLRENTDLSDAVVRQVARMKLDMVGLLHAAALLPADLSGGMRKRAAIARAIALDPEIVFFDEPSAGLDPITAAEVDNVICKLNAVFGITMVVVTHDLPSAWEIADRVAVFLDGRVAMVGDRATVWNATEPRIRDFLDRRMRDDAEHQLDIGRYVQL